MFTKTLISALTLSVIAVSAQAGSPEMGSNLGKDQLALAAGVDANDFTSAELVRLNDAIRANDAEEVAFILSHDNRKRDMVGSSSSGKAQIAASVGADASAYTTTELMRIKDAVVEGDAETEAFYRSHANRAEANPASVVTPGEAQIAASLGVDPADYTLAELATLQSAAND